MQEEVTGAVTGRPTRRPAAQAATSSRRGSVRCAARRRARALSARMNARSICRSSRRRLLHTGAACARARRPGSRPPPVQRDRAPVACRRRSPGSRGPLRSRAGPRRRDRRARAGAAIARRAARRFPGRTDRRWSPRAEAGTPRARPASGPGARASRSPRDRPPRPTRRCWLRRRWRPSARRAPPSDRRSCGRNGSPQAGQVASASGQPSIVWTASGPTSAPVVACTGCPPETWTEPRRSGRVDVAPQYRCRTPSPPFWQCNVSSNAVGTPAQVPEKPASDAGASSIATICDNPYGLTTSPAAPRWHARATSDSSAAAAVTITTMPGYWRSTSPTSSVASSSDSAMSHTTASMASLPRRVIAAWRSDAPTTSASAPSDPVSRAASSTSRRRRWDRDRRRGCGGSATLW